MMLAATDTNGRLHRVQDMSYPEKQSSAWFKKDDLIPTEVRCNFRPKYNILNFDLPYLCIYIVCIPIFRKKMATRRRVHNVKLL